MISRVSTYTLVALAALLIPAREVRSQRTLMPEPDSWSASRSFMPAPAAGDAQWSSALDALNIDGPVYETAVAPNGDLYIGGSFTTIGGVAANRIARWDGTAWHALGTGIPAGTVYTIAFNGGDVYVGGNFKGAADIKASNIARWDGSQWHSLGDITREGVDSTVLAIVVHEGELVVGGNFTYSGNQDQLNFIARYTPADSTFHAIDDGTRAGTDGGVAALLYTPNGDLYAGGIFTKAGGTNASRIAKWAGSTWSALASGMGSQSGGLTPSVRSLALRDSILIAGGTFTFAGGKPTKYLARWTFASNAWGGLAGAGINGTDSDVYKVIVAPSGNVYATGNFSTAGGIPAKRIAYWTTSTSGWFALGSGLDAAGYALAASASKVWVGGAFSHAGASASHYLAQWDESSVGAVNTNAVAAAGTVLHAMHWSGENAEIAFTLAGSGTASLEIVDMRGTVVATPVAGFVSAGDHTAVWNAAGLPAGLYLCRLSSAGRACSGKIMLVR